MDTIVLWGNKLAENILMETKAKLEGLVKVRGRVPTLAVILVGEDPASKVYVAKKHEACKKVGINSLDIKLPEHTEFEKLRDIIMELNERKDVDGILLQLPLPEKLKERTLELVELIHPEKDVDGFTPVNFGLTSIGIRRAVLPCTPKGIIKLLEHYNIEVESKDVVIIGASNIVGKPLANILMNLLATVTVCHIKTKCLEEHTKKADIVVSATGVPHLVKRNMVKEGAVVIDVGISRINGKIIGDVDFDNMLGHASAITPVPGGVGPLTVAMLIENTVECYERRNY